MPSCSRQVARHDEHVAERAFVVVADVVDGGNRLVRHDEHVHRRLRADVAERGDAFVPVHDGGGNLTGDDLLENGGHVSPACARRPVPEHRRIRGQPEARRPWKIPGRRPLFMWLSYGFGHAIRAHNPRLEALVRHVSATHLAGEPARAYLRIRRRGAARGRGRRRHPRAPPGAPASTSARCIFIERVADWDAVRASSNNLSLFGSRKLIEIRLPSGKPGVGGANAIVELLANASPDNVYLMLTGKLEREQNSSAW